MEVTSEHERAQWRNRTARMRANKKKAGEVYVGAFVSAAAKERLESLAVDYGITLQELIKRRLEGRG